MKKLILLAFSILSIAISFGQELELRLNSPSNKVAVGEIVEVQLIVKQLDKFPVLNDEDLNLFSYHQFVYDFSITTEREGKIKLGPYSLKINDKELVSNTIVINVKDKEPRENRIEVNAPKKCEVKNQISIELVSQKAPINKIRLQENPNYKIEGSSSSSNTTIQNGKVTSVHKATFKITFLEKGEYEIDEEWFANIPEFYTIEVAKILVE